ncbi:histidine kinase [Pseudofrankia sp. BMG5.36]|uniref:sensor histidine kinase n=1 Tax=Pseudofrankia sp. BMG5.36 TaxID=1834512 RepID=UPI000A53BB97|nr:histidine kinase [Pseudofrankia sp. BMG5.36]
MTASTGMAMSETVSEPSQDTLTAIRRFFFEPIRGQNAFGREAGVGRWRRTAAIWLVYLGYSVGDLFSNDHPPRIALGLILLAAFAYLYVGPLPRAMFGGPRRYQATVLVGMPGITVVYLVVLGRSGLVMPVFDSVAFAMLLLPVIGLPVILVMAAAVTWLPQYVPSWDLHGEQWSLSGPILLVVFALYVMRTGTRHQIELFQARREIERLAKEQERLRISRDMHDLLGHALTTITVKAELAARLVGRDPDRAAAEMAQVAALGREGLADVRAALAGYRPVSLAGELAAAREVLSAAGIRAQLPAAVEEVPVELSELFGWVLREGVTNVVRHSGARSVQVALTGRSIEVVDDGRGPLPRVPAGPAAPAGPAGPAALVPSERTGTHTARAAPGHGLAGLAERVAAAGGRLETGSARPAPGDAETDAGTDADAAPGAVGGGSGFRLRAVVPA